MKREETEAKIEGERIEKLIQGKQRQFKNENVLHKK